jgi:hypothetical protein
MDVTTLSALEQQAARAEARLAALEEAVVSGA